MIDLRRKQEKDKIKREYIYRLVAVVFGALLVATLFAALSLAPSVIVLKSDISRHEAKKEQIKNSSTEDDTKEINTRIENLQSSIKEITGKSDVIPMVSVLDIILGTKRSGISINSISYDPEAASGNILISGIAGTRNSLREFARVLGDNAEINNVTFPIENLAQESDIEFRISADIKKPNE